MDPVNKAYVATPLLRYGLVFVHISQDDRRLSDPQHSAAGRAKRGALCAHQDMREDRVSASQRTFNHGSGAATLLNCLLWCSLVFLCWS